MSARAWAEVDLGAVRHNTALLATMAGTARVCAVVKANAYGHGAVPVARAALAGGASWLAVATVEEGAALREAQLEVPILLLSEPLAGTMTEVVALGLTPTVYTEGGVAALEAAVTRSARSDPFAVHLKVDTGMRRVGASPAEGVKLALGLQASTALRLGGAWTHFAVADDPDNPFTAEQDRSFRGFLDDLEALGIAPGIPHSCNSAGVLVGRHPCYEMVRCGIAIYGVAPSEALRGAAALRPAMALKARVSHVKVVGPGQGVSYGLRYRTDRATVLATVPIGYADGVPWRLGGGNGPALDDRDGGEVLIGGRRRPIAGSVTMDQIMVDCGPAGRSDAPPVEVDDEVVLLGRQGVEEIEAWEWAGRVGTIAYEVLCGVGPRVPRIHLP